MINDIVKIKGNFAVSISGKRIEQLTDDDLDRVTEKKLKEEKTKIEIKIKENLQNKEAKEFSKQDYFNRAVREFEISYIQQQWTKENESIDDIINKAKEAHEYNVGLKKQLIVAKELRDSFVGSIKEKAEKEYKQLLADFQKKVAQEYRNKILETAKEKFQIHQ